MAKEISEPVYEGFITIEEDELPIVESPTVQRLRRVHQLGLSKSVYPGASHTRFEHSIGVMHLAGRIADSIGLTPIERKTYRLAGLLHDIGHPPYSHSLEPIMEEQMDISHEEHTCRLIDQMDVDFPVPVESIKEAILGESQYGIVAGPVDADRMDYLRRDALETGVPHGQVDTASIIEFAEVHDGQLAFYDHAVPALEGLFTSRLHMMRSVYAHHTARILEMLLQRAVEDYLEEEDVAVTELMTWDDYQLHSHLLDSEGLSRQLYEKIANRNPYKRALYLGEEELGRSGLQSLATSSDDHREIERDIADIVGINPVDVLVDYPSIPTESDYTVNIIDGDDVTPLSALSELPSTVAEAEWSATTLGVYTPEEHVKEVAEAANRVLF